MLVSGRFDTSSSTYLILRIRMGVILFATKLFGTYLMFQASSTYTNYGNIKKLTNFYSDNEEQ